MDPFEIRQMPSNNEAPEADEPNAPAFIPDYKYATDEQIQEVTRNHLAKLEVELHTLRMAFVANGENPNLQVAPGRTIVDEMNRTKSAISTLENHFQAIF